MSDATHSAPRFLDGTPSPLTGPDGDCAGLITYEATLQRFRFQSEDGMYSVADFVTDQRLLFTATGLMVGLQPGDYVEVTGRWTDSRYGRQLKVRHALPRLPITAKGIEQFIATQLEGVGPKLAHRIVRAFGASTLRVLEETPERLREVRGLGARKCEAIRASWRMTQATRKIMMTLLQYGISPVYIARIRRTFDDTQILDLLQHDPFQLTRVDGIGFKIADRIAREAGFEPHHPARLEAGLEHLLDEAERGQGHCYLPADALCARSAELLAVDRPLVDDAFDNLVSRHRLIVEHLEAGEPIAFRRHVHRAEHHIADELIDLLRACPEPDDARAERVRDLIARAERDLGLRLADAQRAAVELALLHPIVVVTGGPGTGKTTLVRVLVEVCAALNEDVQLSAPTGRAAKRMTEATGRDARTLHRLLEYSFQNGGFQRGGDNHLDPALFVIDESSMIDIYLMRALLRALPPGARLVLVGDVDQLPSVGPGTVLRDFIDSRAVPIVRLARVFRQAAASLIVRNAHRINAGQLPLRPAAGEPADCYIMHVDSADEAERTIVDLVADRLPAHYDLDAMNDIQVLCPMRVRAAGADAVNLHLQSRLNPDGAPISNNEGGIRVGDRVMQLRNNYDKDVFNGDVGRVERWDPADKRAIVVFDDEREVRYSREEISDLSLAYACTVHKSQGSEYPVVVIPLVRQHHVLLQRNLLYTALTRARRLAVLVVDPRALRTAIQNAQASDRNTRLASRLCPASALVGPRNLGTVTPSER